MSKKRTKLIIYIIAGILIIFGVVLKLRWHAWFYNKPEMPYITPYSIDRVTLSPGENFSNERTISWRCDTILHDAGIFIEVLQDSVTINQKTDYAQVIQSRSGKGAYYQVHLRDLPYGSYRYKIFTGDKISDYYHFEVKPLTDSLSFLFIGDVQDPDGHVSDSLFTKLRQSDVYSDFIAMCGDQIEGPCDNFWGIWFNSLGSWAGQMPLLVSTGNHEYFKNGFFREIDPRWVPQFGYPHNGPEGFEGKSYYVDFPLCRFIVMDSEKITTIPAIIKHRSWLKDIVSKSGKKWNILMMHHAMDCIREGRTNIAMHYFFKPLVLDLNIDLVLQGHDHSYARWITKKDNRETTPVRVISVSSPKLYPNKFDEDIDRIGSGMAMYQNIQVYRDSIVYKSFEFDNTIYDYVVIHKQKNEVFIDDKAKYWEEKFLYDGFAKNKKGEKARAKYIKAKNERSIAKNS